MSHIGKKKEEKNRFGVLRGIAMGVSTWDIQCTDVKIKNKSGRKANRLSHILSVRKLSFLNVSTLQKY